MQDRVIDSSALAAVMFNEPDADLVADVTVDQRLLAPYLLVFELASVCRKKILAEPRKRELYLEAFAGAEELPIRYADTNPSAVIALALHLGVTTYDAFYLNLALETGAPLVTVDRDLAKAAEKVLPRGHVLPRRH